MRAHQSFRHEALLYRNSSEFLDAVVPFIADGVALRQPVMVAVSGPRIEAIRGALGSLADGVTFADMSEVGRNPARIIPVAQGFLAANGGGAAPVRGVGEPIWAGRSSTEITECQLHEGLLNLAIPPDCALWLMCPYDVQSLDRSVTDHARQSHPVIVDRGEYRGSTRYGGAFYVQDLFRRGLPAPPAVAESRTFGLADLGDVTNRVLGAAFRAGLDADRSRALAGAIRELAIDAAEAGHGTATLRVWRADNAIVCEVNDSTTLDDPIIGRVEATTRAGRKGLWLANKTSDLIQVRSNESGTTVRVHTWL